MKKFLLLLLLSTSLGAYAQTFQADDVTGTWLTQDKSGQVSIYKTDSKYYGKIIGGNSQEHFDVHNPDAQKRKEPLIGLVILKDFKFDGDDQWGKGTIYDPKSGKTYSCTMTITDKNTLRIRGISVSASSEEQRSGRGLIN
ncbi:DUF2147 domain-containing protein [Paraflavitalea speifideaquila]|uniref:DUF2147 domain-containing protein n=1 Tax=Paraflavitalea speifideaquila TaxID=3076558 RepID=UPI0028EE964E|nr:DUF2147 domain-containing protein [Paraflavitalea speifideiaquila]